MNKSRKKQFEADNLKLLAKSETMEADQEGLLPDRGTKMHGLNWASNNSNNNNSSNYITTGLRKNNLLIIVVGLVFTTCLLVYLYLNMQALDSNRLQRGGDSGSGAMDSSMNGESNKYNNINSKPLSRRRPMLDDESIFSDSGPSMIRLSDLLAHCIVALKVAGRDVVNSSLSNNMKLDNVSSKGLTREGAVDVVTGADMRSHETIVGTIKDSFPRLRIVSEEDETKGYGNMNQRLPIARSQFAQLLQVELQEIQRLHVDWGSLIAQDDTLVWVDPLDATKEYSENLTNYVTLMACIVYKSQPIAGVIYKPFSNESFWSIKDQPSEKHHYSPDLNELLSANKDIDHDKEQKRLKVIVSRSHAGDVKDVLHNHYNDSVDVISAGGSGFKTVELLAGRADAYVHLTHIKKWDICAPDAILNSIDGAKFTDRNGKTIKFGNRLEKIVESGVVASLNGDTHKDMVDNLRIGDQQPDQQNM